MAGTLPDLGWIQVPILSNASLGLAVEANGVKGCLVIDTGAGKLSMRMASAKQLGVTLKQSTETVTGIGGRTKIMKGDIEMQVQYGGEGAFPSLSGTQSFLSLPAVTGPEDIGNSLGVIGIRELSGAGVILDCFVSRMLLGGGDDFQAPDDYHRVEMIPLPFGKEEGFLWGVPVKIGTVQGLMVVDTAAQISVIENKFAPLAGIELKPTNVWVVGSGGEGPKLTNATIASMWVADEVELGRLNLAGVDMPVFRKLCRKEFGDKMPFAGILGLDQLRRMKACINCRSGQLHARKQSLEEDGASIFGPDPKLVIDALKALARSGEQEAKGTLRDARANQGRITLNNEQKHRIIDRAREKGVLKTGN